MLAMMQRDVVTDKNALRIQLLARRERLDPKLSAQAAQAVAASLLEVIVAGPTIVAGYSPMRGELNIIEAMSQLSARGHTLCLPGIESSDKPLHFRRWRIGDILEKGRYGIDVPPPGAPVFKPDTVLVPMIAFDRTGHRLGYGAGYYDRTIQELRGLEKGVQVIGVAYAMQEVGHLPADAHDEKMDIIITEKEIIRL